MDKLFSFWRKEKAEPPKAQINKEEERRINAEAEVQRLSIQLNAKTEEAQTLSSQLTASNEELQTLRDQLNSASQSAKNQLNIKIQEEQNQRIQLESLRAELTKKEAKINEIEYNNNNLKHEAQLLQENIHQLKTSLQEIKEEAAEDKRTIGNLLSARAMVDGMYVVGSPVLECVQKFKDLRDNALTNLLFELTDDSDLQDQLLPQLSRIAFHDFWSVLKDDITAQERTELAKKIKEDPGHASKVAEVAEQTVRKILQGEGDNPMDKEELRKQLKDFYNQCAVLVASIELCDPALDFLPRGQLPKKGTLVNAIASQPFEYDFGIGYPVVEAVELPGLAARDLKGTIFCKAVIKCKFPPKK